MTQVKKLDFSGTTIYCGVDVHKKSWRVNIQDEEFELEDFTQNPDAVLLHKHLVRRYPGAYYKVGYEAGFSGFSTQRTLAQQSGCQCWVVNAADIPAGDKDKKQKQDKGDARKLCNYLQSKKLKGIYIPDEAWEHARTLVRTRERIVNNQTRTKNRIWQLLYFSGLPVPAQQDGQYWSKRFVEGLQKMSCGGSAHLQQSLQLHIKDFLQTRQLLLEATRAIRALCKEQKYGWAIKLLRSIPGIGEINAAVILFELQDITRFKRFDYLCSYVGLVPDTSDSGDTKRTKGITHRHNYYLRAALVESSWPVIRKDPALLMMYKKYCSRMDKNKAIIRIAKHLLSRISYILKTRKEYVTGVVA
jgi:transposase